MTWKLIEWPDGHSVDLSDEEVIQVYILLVHGSSNSHREIAAKLEPVYRIAKHNITSSHNWETEGGTCHGEKT